MIMVEPLFVGNVVSAAILLFLFNLGYLVFKAKEKTSFKETNKKQRETLARITGATMSTSLHVIFFIPLFWITIIYFHTGIGAIMALIWFVGRVTYIRDYVFDAYGGELGSIMTYFVIGVLFLTSLGGFLFKFLA